MCHRANENVWNCSSYLVYNEKVIIDKIYNFCVKIASGIMLQNEHSERPQHEFKRIKLYEECPR